LRDDYLKSEYFHDLSIIINLSVNSATNYSQANANEKKVTDQLLRLVSGATIVVGNDATGKLDEHLWFNIFLLSKVTATEIANRPIDRIEQNEICSKFCNREEFFLSPYESLVGLPLRAHEEDGCYRDCESAACDVVDMVIVELLSQNQYPCVSVMYGLAHGYLQG
jgi:hypothetical protein